jgi:hypothetical protein
MIESAAKRSGIWRIKFNAANLVREIAQAFSLWGNRAFLPGYLYKVRTHTCCVIGSSARVDGFYAVATFLKACFGETPQPTREVRAGLALRALPRQKKLHAGASAAVVSRVFHRPAFRFNFRKAGAAFHFHDLVAQERSPLELEIGRGALHFVFQLAE